MGFPQVITNLDGLGWRQADSDSVDHMPLEIKGFDTLSGGCPRGRITEIVGSASAGRTSLLHRLLARAGANGEYCAVVDTTNSFDPESAAAAGVRLDTLVWVRCSGSAEHAMKAADLLLHSGGFGVVALDLCDVSPQNCRRIPLSYWHRFRRAVENGSTILLVMGREANAKSCASLLVEVRRTDTAFLSQNGHAHREAESFPVKLLRSATFSVSARRPFQTQAGRITAVCQPG